ncbi:nucleoside triphosphate pyrophosphohydrolase [Limimaricola cinnabarinus]|uniref:Nucleoside triphosphate pyrophosphohydrolase n=1 Tax=Limimaricola cinnabarinus LL-001 TaxID=1337093 RepID=U2YJ97_9RHOB|nr:nucleoside triphosphate pyrophosphohydrolase [Limimaricola cinnabarinus]GAD54886.1 nucleoside triphosphate pyrophosphohydrolase MazG [Limimaricola cinnabarinus LL-001]
MPQTEPEILETDRDAAREIARLSAIMRALRDPDHGCPWDIEQDFASITPYTIEEAYEVADAIAREDWPELRGELGDLLLQSVYHAQMATEAGYFDLAGVARAISDKMIARHPHVFGEESRDRTAQEQTQAWEAIKAAERAGKSETGVLDGVALGLPALMRAAKLQKRAARVGFDWPQTAQVLDKLIEEAHELVEARDTLGEDEIEAEMGDLLFVMANLARHMGVDPEVALRRSNDKFTRRFKYIERELQKRGKRPVESDLDEMDALWNEIRGAEKTAD